MATVFNSDQQTAILSTSGKAPASDVGGRVRRLYFSKTLPASGLATGDSIICGPLPKNARILGGQFVWDTAQGVTATTAVGDAGSTGRYFAAAVTNALTIFRIADTYAQNYGYSVPAPTSTNDNNLQLLNAAAAWTASSKVSGHIDYMTD